MSRILLIGLTPDTVDFSDPDLPPGLTQGKIAAGIEATLSDMRGCGWHPEFCGIEPDADAAEKAIASALAGKWDCVVVGGGIRMPKKMLLLFERVVNAIREHAPTTPIAFNTSPEDSTEAARRWLKP